MPHRIWYRPWPRRIRSALGKRGQVILSALFGLILALVLISVFESTFRPRLITLAETKVLNRLTLISNQALTDSMAGEGLTYSDMVHLSPGQAGGVATISTDMVVLNRLRSEVLGRIVTQVEDLDSYSLGIPFGSLTGFTMFSALGPYLPVRVLSVASARGDYRNEFSEAGINQTLHRILLDVTVTANLMLPGGIEIVSVCVPVCVTETIIVGNVPQTYMNWKE